MKLFVFHTPELVPTQPLPDASIPNRTVPDCAIAIDVLRATTTIATALAVGGEAVQVFSDMTELMEASAAWPESKRLRAGERGGHRVEGCELGNSPLDCTPELFGDRRLFISTTNGTRALQCVRHVPTVLTGALINRHAVVRYLVEKQPDTIWLVASGWEGSFSLEDTVCAGAIADLLSQQLGLSPAELAGNDELINAVSLYQTWNAPSEPNGVGRLLDLLKQASHGQRLLRLNCLADLEYCATLDSVDILPIQTEPGVLKRYNSKT